MGIPAYASNAIMNQGQGGLGQKIFGSGYSQGTFGGGVGQILSGLFSDSGAPYEAAGDQYQKYAGQAQAQQNPFYNAGTSAIPKYQQFVDKQADPVSFINNIQGQYQQSPFAKYQQNNAMRAARNLGSATGLTGSTPLTQFAEQNANDISGQDMQSWLQNVLGINRDYGSGLNNEMQYGQHSADMMSQILSQLGLNMGDAAYGEESGDQKDQNSIFSGAGSIASMFMGGA